jgi:hypothetical protein
MYTAGQTQEIRLGSQNTKVHMTNDDISRSIRNVTVVINFGRFCPIAERNPGDVGELLQNGLS